MDSYNYKDWQYAKSRIGKRIAEMGMTDENYEVDCWDSLFDDGQVMVVYRPPCGCAPIALSYDPSASLAEAFYDAARIHKYKTTGIME